MKQIVKLLEGQVGEFKQAYLERVERWAGEEIKRCQALAQEWGDLQRSLYRQEGIKVIRLPKPQRYWDLEKEVAKIAPIKYTEKFIALELKQAEDHFKAALEKLAFRIEKKDLKKDLLEIQAQYLGVHFECIITDGEKKVKAWTIIAEGPVQRPHYRYLIK